MAERYNEQALANLAQVGGAVPGQSLTNDPDQKYPWEQPPRFTNQQEALDFMVSELLEDETLYPIMRSISKGVPIGDIVSLMLNQGFQAGLFNPDLMILLIEPLHFVLMAICEKAGIEYLLYDGENEEEEYESNIEEDDDLDPQTRGRINSLVKMSEKFGKQVEKEDIQLPTTIEQQIEEADVIEELGASLLERQEPAEPSESLLERRTQ
jgi:hypothetical protein